MQNSLSSLRRRRVLVAAATGVAAAVVLAGCASGGASTSSSSGTPSYGALNVQLSYLKNTEFAGEFEADSKGYFKAAGFNPVTLTAGGGSASIETEVATGKMLIGDNEPQITAPAILKGAGVKIIAAEYQKNAFDVVSEKSNPINTPADLKGKTVAVSSFNTSVWDTFLKANGLTTSDMKIVPYTDGASQLASGQVQAYLGFSTGFTDTVGTKNIPVQQFLLADEGLPGVTETLIASDDSIKNHRAEVLAALTAIVHGWKDAIADPSGATKLTVDDYGKSQNYTYASQLAAITAQKSLMVTTDTDTNGLLTITPALQAETVASLKVGGVDITTAKLFDTSLITEVYKNHPSWK
jgi:ABC-type nitrate/sulfonate/bicarbonate transport system substrate-binding protein